MKSYPMYIFLIVRSGSTRLPNKALKKIGNEYLIEFLINRIRQIKEIDKVVVCTTDKKSDDELVSILKKNNVDVFRGDEQDVLDRLYNAAKKFQVKEFLVVEGDDVFCEPIFIKETYKKLKGSDKEFLFWENVPFGVSPLGLRFNKLQEIVNKKKTKNTDTGWGRFIIQSGLFKVEKLEPIDDDLKRPDIRLSVDYQEDLNLIMKIFEHLPKVFTLKDIIAIIDENPSWMMINESARRKYKENFENKAIGSGEI